MGRKKLKKSMKATTHNAILRHICNGIYTATSNIPFEMGPVYSADDEKVAACSRQQETIG